MRRFTRLRLPGGDAGSVSVIAYAIAFPAVLAILTAFMQAALWFAARDAAIAAAQQGVAAARAAGGSLGQGQAAACRYAVSVASGVLRSPTCAGSGGTTITITVCGDAPSLLAGFPVRACEQAQGARERFTARTSP